MEKIRSYHCNICGAFIFIGESHICDNSKIEMIKKIADLLSKGDEASDELKEIFKVEE
ncbi:MAG: hypothetical protein JNN15_00355 [Blastocatellia bacterium]|nr:hypothetical protein [Blastocatellia bacterium]